MAKNNSVWSNDIDAVLNNIRQNCMMLHEQHKKQYYALKGYLKYFRIPTIILSGFNSVISIGLSAYVEQNLVSIITCLISLTCGIIVSVELYLSIQTNMQNDLEASKEFYLLGIDIFKTLSLQPINRMVHGKTYLDQQYGVYCKLIESSNLVHKKIKDKLLSVSIGDNGSLSSLSVSTNSEEV